MPETHSGFLNSQEPFKMAECSFSEVGHLNVDAERKASFETESLSSKAISPKF